MKKNISSVSGSTDSTCLESFQKDAVWERLHHRKSSQVNIGRLSCTKGTRAWQTGTARSNTNSFHIKIWRYQQEDEPLILIFSRAPTRHFFIHFLEALLPACLDFSVAWIQNGFKSKQVGGGPKSSWPKRESTIKESRAWRTLGKVGIPTDTWV